MRQHQDALAFVHGIADCARRGIDVRRLEVLEFDAALRADAHRSVRERRTAKALFEQIRALGYRGSYPRVVVWVRRWREREANAPRRAAFVPLSFIWRSAICPA